MPPTPILAQGELADSDDARLPLVADPSTFAPSRRPTGWRCTLPLSSSVSSSADRERHRPARRLSPMPCPDVPSPLPDPFLQPIDDDPPPHYSPPLPLFRLSSLTAASMSSKAFLDAITARRSIYQLTKQLPAGVTDATIQGLVEEVIKQTPSSVRPCLPAPRTPRALGLLADTLARSPLLLLLSPGRSSTTRARGPSCCSARSTSGSGTWYVRPRALLTQSVPCPKPEPADGPSFPAVPAPVASDLVEARGAPRRRGCYSQPPC